MCGGGEKRMNRLPWAESNQKGVFRGGGQGRFSGLHPGQLGTWLGAGRLQCGPVQLRCWRAPLAEGNPVLSEACLDLAP